MLTRGLMVFGIWLLTVPAVSAQNNNNLKEVFADIYQSVAPEYYASKKSEFADFCKTYQLDATNTKNRKQFHQLYFYHDLFTGTAAVDGSVGGILKIPYFWHWVDPNPRHTIKRYSDRLPLAKIPAPSRFAKYKSHADIDRIPSLFLGDLFNEKPNYFHKEIGSFYTFGWCSEREMAFSLLLSLYGYKSKITQKGIHVWSAFWVSFYKTDNQPVNLIAKIDNTFDSIDWNPAPKLSKPQWLNQVQNIKMVKWYNSQAKSEQEIKRVKSIKVPARAARRIKKMIDQSWSDKN